MRLTPAPLVLLAVVALAACGEKTVSASSTTGAEPRVTVTVAPAPQANPLAPVTDPYEVYLANNPDPSLILTRDEAMARAFLGCGQTWPPGTVDAVLADAYRPGLCE